MKRWVVVGKGMGFSLNGVHVSLIPKPLWGRNVRAIVSQETWEYLRLEFHAESRKVCRICKAASKHLDLHEVFYYDDVRRVQALVDLVPVCPLCHHVLHMGYSHAIGRSELSKERLVQVLGISSPAAEKVIGDLFREWQSRSAVMYKQDFSWLLKYVSEDKIHMNWLENPRQPFHDRGSVIRWANECVDSDAVIVDTETTGLYPKGVKNPVVEPVQIAVMDMKGKVLFNEYIRPTRKMPKKTILIHGIENEFLADKETFPDVYPDLSIVLNGRHAIAYNSDFDRRVLSDACARYHLPNLDLTWTCAMKAYRSFLQQGRYEKLPGARHGAAEDCAAVLDLIRRISSCDLSLMPFSNGSYLRR